MCHYCHTCNVSSFDFLLPQTHGSNSDPLRYSKLDKQEEISKSQLTLIEKSDRKFHKRKGSHLFFTSKTRLLIRSEINHSGHTKGVFYTSMQININRSYHFNEYFENSHPCLAHKSQDLFFFAGRWQIHDP